MNVFEIPQVVVEINYWRICMKYLVNIIIYHSVPYTNQFIINKENLVKLP